MRKEEENLGYSYVAVSQTWHTQTHERNTMVFLHAICSANAFGYQKYTTKNRLTALS